MLQVNNSKTRARCEKCSKLTIKTPERLASGVFIVNFENIVLHIVLVVLLFYGSIVVEQVNVGWVRIAKIKHWKISSLFINLLLFFLAYLYSLFLYIESATGGVL